MFVDDGLGVACLCVYQSVYAKEIVRVELLQVVGKKEAVFADGFAVEADLTAAVFGALDLDHVPVDL